MGAAISYRVIAILLGIDVLANALTGGRQYQTISCRIGESIQSGGWASKVSWPRWWVSHCISSVFETIV
jgi:hypothetical protein